MKANITKKEWATTVTDSSGNVISVVTTIITMVAIQTVKELASVRSDS